MSQVDSRSKASRPAPFGDPQRAARSARASIMSRRCFPPIVLPRRTTRIERSSRAVPLSSHTRARVSLPQAWQLHKTASSRLRQAGGIFGKGSSEAASRTRPRCFVYREPGHLRRHDASSDCHVRLFRSLSQGGSIGVVGEGPRQVQLTMSTPSSALRTRRTSSSLPGIKRQVAVVGSGVRRPRSCRATFIHVLSSRETRYRSRCRPSRLLTRDQEVHAAPPSGRALPTRARPARPRAAPPARGTSTATRR